MHNYYYIKGADPESLKYFDSLEEAEKFFELEGEGSIGTTCSRCRRSDTLPYLIRTEGTDLFTCRMKSMCDYWLEHGDEIKLFFNTLELFGKKK